MKYRYLENTEDNHNKYYEMIENPGGRKFTAKYGKIGVTKIERLYDMSVWDKKYDEKIKKGYKDLTHTRTLPQNEKDNHDKHKNQLERVDKVLVLLHAYKNDMENAEEDIRDVNAIRETLKDGEPPLNGLLSKWDMEYLNRLWKQLKSYAPKT